MRNSYVERIVQGYPEVKLPLSDEQIAKVKLAGAGYPQEKFVFKSERVSQMQKELEIAQALCAKANNVAFQWEGEGKASLDALFPSFKFEAPKFDKYWTDGIGQQVKERVDAAQNIARFYAQSMQDAALALRNNLVEARNTLASALEAEEKGLAGEAMVEDYLRRNLSCRILSNVILPAVRNGDNDPKTAETDLLVVCGAGVFVCEIKNYGKAGQILEIQPDGEVVKTNQYGRSMEYMGSPFRQNARHENAVRQVLAKAGLANIPVYSVLIIANTEVGVRNHSQYIVKDMYQFRDMVQVDDSKALYSAEMQNAIYEAILSRRLGERKFPVMTVSAQADAYWEAMAILENAKVYHSKWVRDTENTASKWVAAVISKWERKNIWLILLWNAYEDAISCSAFCFFLSGVACVIGACVIFGVFPIAESFGGTLCSSLMVACFILYIPFQLLSDKSRCPDFIVNAKNNALYFAVSWVRLFLPRLLLNLLPSIFVMLDLLQTY